MLTDKQTTDKSALQQSAAIRLSRAKKQTKIHIYILTNISTKVYQQSMLINLQGTLEVGISCIMFILVKHSLHLIR